MWENLSQYIVIDNLISGVPRGLSHWENSAEGGHKPTLRKTWEMMVNPDVDGDTKSLNQQKIPRKSQKNTADWKPTEY